MLASALAFFLLLKEEKGENDYALRRQINEKPSIILGCPGAFFQLICSAIAS